MFQPPRCPNRRCPQHQNPTPGFFVRKGFYHPLCRALPVPRFQCRVCERGFSRQTFRADYRDHRPDLNAPLFLSLSSGVGLRQTARTLHLTYGNTVLKFRKLARHVRRLNLNLRGPLPEGSRLQLDEFETYEGRRNTRPLTVPVLIERETRYVIWAESATIRPRGRMSEAREQAIAEDERRHGPRKDNSERALQRTLARGVPLVAKLEQVVLETDEKSSYPNLAKEAFGEERLVHQTTNSQLVRGTFNPLFPINHTEAMLRDLLGRVRRESWLVSKRRRYLDLGLQLFMAYRNYVRRRFNHDEESAAQLAGFVQRRLTPGEVLGWRQDWGAERSIHPTSRSSARASASGLASAGTQAA